MGIFSAAGGAVKNAGMNALSNTGSNLNGVLGNVSKAVLMFPMSDMDTAEVELREIRNDGTVSGGISDMMKSTEALAKDDKLLQEMKKKIKTNTGKMAGFSLDKWYKQNYRMFTVQFNPSNIRITSRGGGMVPVTDYGTNGTASGIKICPLDPYAEISFMIVFDDTNNADAFMFDKFTLSPTATAKNLSAMAFSAFGEEYTVRPQVEGFIGALRNKYHRIVLFQWGNMRYWGVLNNIQSRYTLFNTQGEPVRAEVSVSISSGTSSNKDDNFTPYWQNQYDKFMKELSNEKDGLTYGTSGGTAHNNRFNNLLNI